MSASAISRGAASGAIGAAVWAATQPLDKLLLGSRYDDVELLGRALSADEDKYVPLGLIAHLLNGAAFGAGYAQLAPGLPGPAWLKGPAVSLAENTLLWPLGFIVDRFHPRRDKLPFRLAGNRRAFYQATWRHLLFGAVLGELERRLNPPLAPSDAVISTVYSTNGHGNVDHVAAQTPDS
ncbi:MAG: hypothetical protein J2O48_04005 [Solirubrobacterales bacterium]|nr:hypothetical protein [Solirubrobacterales bacterium]